MYKLLLFFVLTVIVAGCSTVSPNNPGTHMNSGVLIKYVNDKGENLLNPAHPHAITEQNTNLYFLVNGKKKKIYKPHLDTPKMFFIANNLDSTGEYLMAVNANTLPGQNTAITYIVFKDYPTDTLKIQYKSINGVALTKAWINGKLRLDKTKMHTSELSKLVIVVTKHLSKK